MPIYDHLCEECNYEWDDLFKMSDPVPTICPSCNTSGKIKRLISVCVGRVELGFQEQKQQIKDDRKRLSKEVRNNENLRANIVGESNYNRAVTTGQSLTNELVKIGSAVK